ncbi:SCO2521 family protein [Phytomonospora sp. NPDC050363]|uniref:SCO2521 family protein n=1 Tax=Phytomonospora sp. NPDC050363 TaxID=3155642 RepID=UPI0033C424F5
MITVGEVHTALLQHSAAAHLDRAGELLDLVIGDRVRTSERPIAYAASPELLTGIDCTLPTAGGAHVRGIGTVTTRALLTGGRILQGSTYGHVVKSRHTRRMPWSHYLSQPGIIEAVGKADIKQLADGFRNPIAGTESIIDLGSISGRTIDAVQAKTDRDKPIESERTRLRWVAVEGDQHNSLMFSIDAEHHRTARFPAGNQEPAVLAELAADIAVHDWLLTTTLAFVEKVGIGSKGRDGVIKGLRPLIDHILHLWMPAARLHPSLSELWESLERRPGFSRQWNTLIARIRDQLMLATIASPSGDSSLDSWTRPTM